MSRSIGPAFGSMDFLSFTESLHTPLAVDGPGHLSKDCDLLFVIGAPADFRQVPGDAMVVLFLDTADQERTLPANGYQVVCPQPLRSPQFLLWSQQAMEMLRGIFLHPGLVCMDLADLRDILLACSTRRLVLHIIDYGDQAQLPLEAIQAARFRNLFGCVFSGLDFTLARYGELAVAIEQHNPDLASFKLGARYHVKPTTEALMLGELMS